MNKKGIGDFIRNYMAWVILLAVMLAFSFTPNFLSLRNIINMLNQSSYIIVASIGVGFLMMSGEIDLSVGYMMSLSSIISGTLIVQMGVPVIVAVPLVLLLGAALSCFNNFLSSLLHLGRFMTTVATMSIYQGASYVISQSVAIKGFPDSFKAIGQSNIGIIPTPIIIMLVLLIVCSVIMEKTYFGQYVYALGGNPEAAKLAGINVNAMKYIISAIAGALISLSAIMLTARLGTAHSTTGPGSEFTALIGILLGGISIRGGEGKLSSVFAGVMIISILSNGMQLAGLDTYYQFIAKGIIMLLAIGIDVFNLNRRNKVKKEKKADA